MLFNYTLFINKKGYHSLPLYDEGGEFPSPSPSLIIHISQSEQEVYNNNYNIYIYICASGGNFMTDAEQGRFIKFACVSRHVLNFVVAHVPKIWL